MYHVYSPPRPHEVARVDGSLLTERIPFWSIQKNNHGITRVEHQVTHFTHPDDDNYDSHGRALYVTLHQFVSMETAQTIPQLLSECPQFSLSRDRAPSYWPIAVKKNVYRLSRIGVQVFQRHFICEDEDFDMEMRRELPSKRLY